MNVRATLGSALLALSACGGAPPQTGSASVVGSIGGVAFVPRDAVSTTLSDGYGDSEAVIVLADVPDLCARVMRRDGLRNAHVLMLTLATSGAEAVVAPSGPGTFTRKPPGLFSLWGFATDDSCGLVDGSERVPGTTGQVDLASVDGGAYGGSFEIPLYDLDFAAQGVIRGTFQAGACAEAAELVALPPARVLSSCE
jgi:hypothetical protein